MRLIIRVYRHTWLCLVLYRQWLEAGTGTQILLREPVVHVCMGTTHACALVQYPVQEITALLNNVYPNPVTNVYTQTLSQACPFAYGLSRHCDL